MSALAQHLEEYLRLRCSLGPGTAAGGEVSRVDAMASAGAWQPEQLILVSIERGGVQSCQAELR